MRENVEVDESIKMVKLKTDDLNEKKKINKVNVMIKVKNSLGSILSYMVKKLKGNINDLSSGGKINEHN